MSETFFSKLDATEKSSRLTSLASARGLVTLWIKGSKQKLDFVTLEFDKIRQSLVLETKDDIFPIASTLLCSFEFRGMNFFSQVRLQKNPSGNALIEFTGDFFKSERRNSYRLMTYPIYQVWGEFDLGESYQGSNVVGLKSKTSQTNIFKSFINLVNEHKDSEADISVLKIRIQDISTTGMAIHIGELENPYFGKDQLFKKVRILFPDQLIEIPLVRVMYAAPYVGPDRNIRKFKIGLHFEELSLALDQALGKKINELLRENDNNKDFENFIK